ncbi:MAG: T9SS type A sorting domain-containing protein [Bacteroidetes bacterium]|nr:T9SS type A sorting domain-containing protein [Bacteroidota bacterium]
MKRIFTTLIALLLVQSVFACSASFGWYQSPTATSALNVNFYNTSSYGTTSPGSAWIYYGDGSSGYFSTATSSLSHGYASPGTYNLEMTIYVYDSLTSTYCTDSVRDTITIDYPPCASTVGTAISGSTVTFAATTPAGTTGMTYDWSFGDGTTGTGSPVSHTYTTIGTHNVTLVAYSSSPSCLDSVFFDVTTGTGANVIGGYINRDTVTSPSDTAVYKVWLITYDSSTHIIQAVDSQTIISPYTSTYYSFSGKPTGSYLVKAHITNGPTSGSGYIPTYHDSSAYWSGALFVAHNSAGPSYGVDIWMKHGTVISGPGFIAGNVLYGAGKTTGGGPVGAPVTGLLVMLRDVKNNIVASTYTDASGNYKISNIPYGTYSIYPEDMGYKTTAWGSINITSANPHVNGINFTQNSTSIKPGTTAVPTVAGSVASVAVYPNPTSGKLTIQWDASVSKTANVNVTNIAGQTVYSTQLNIDGVERSEVNLTNLNAGLYFMNITSGNLNYTQKISIQH